MRGRATLVAVAVAVSTVAGSGTAAVADRPPDARVPRVADWLAAGQNAHNTRDAGTERLIDRTNVGRLKPRWVFTTGGDVIATPAVPRGVVYVPDAAGTLWALRSTDAAVVWSKRISDYTGQAADGSRTTPAIDGDFGSMPNFFTARIGGRDVPMVGVGQKSGSYWALDARTGQVVWSVKVGPSGPFGGIQWGSATDGERIYVAAANSARTPVQVAAPGRGTTTVTGGLWAALDPATGRVLWRTPDPQGAIDMGFVSVADGVVYAGSGASTGDTMYALDARTGAVLWGYPSGGSVIGGAAIVDGSVYWGSGYYIGQDDNRLYAFDRG